MHQSKVYAKNITTANILSLFEMFFEEITKIKMHKIPKKIKKQP